MIRCAQWLVDLIDASGPRVLHWMKRKAALADGTSPGLPVVPEDALEAVLMAFKERQPEAWRIGRRDGWMVLAIGLARQLCGAALKGIGARHRRSESGVHAIVRLHGELLGRDGEYASRAEAVAREVLDVWKLKKGAWHRTSVIYELPKSFAASSSATTSVPSSSK